VHSWSTTDVGGSEARAATLLPLSLLPLSLLPSAAAFGISSFEVYEIDQLSPVNISRKAPTGSLQPSALPALNLPVWARNVTQRSLDAVKAVGSDPSAHLGDIQQLVASGIDVDLTVQMCSWQDPFSHPTACSLKLTPTEDHNRYLDLRVTTSTFDRFPTVIVIRLVVAEDASKAVNVPLSFDALVAALRVDDVDRQDDFLGQHLAPSAAASALGKARLPWAAGSLVDAVVRTTRGWNWAPCSNRSRLRTDGSAAQSYEDAIKAALAALASPGWTVGFETPVTGRSGISFQVQYSLCGHLMWVPATVQSAPPPSPPPPLSAPTPSASGTGAGAAEADELNE